VPIRLGENSYGKTRVRLLRVARQEGRHDIKELTVAIRFEGEFETAHTKGDNRKILPTDTMKNTVYALARQHSIETVEEFGLHLMEHFVTYTRKCREYASRSRSTCGRGCCTVGSRMRRRLLGRGARSVPPCWLERAKEPRSERESMT